MSKGRRNKHQAAQVEVVNLGNRLGYRGKCRCGWASLYTRATAEAAAKDAEAHILEKK